VEYRIAFLHVRLLESGQLVLVDPDSEPGPSGSSKQAPTWCGVFVIIGLMVECESTA
jgi:hypothetical protein